MKKLILILLINLLVLYLPVFAYPVDETSDIYINVKDFGASGDGVTNDTSAILNAVKKAHTESKTVYFSDGTYVLSETINLNFDNAKTITFQGSKNAVIITPEGFEGDMIFSLMEHGFAVKDLTFIHKGTKGRILNTHNCVIYDAVFEGGPDNADPLVSFAGSNCKVAGSTFKTGNFSAFSVEYIRREGKISINDYITDNTFEGIGSGIMVGADSADGRPEGLKISGNTFKNTGAGQVLVEAILHIDISDNTFTGEGEAAIRVFSKGVGVHGLYITGNSIEGKKSCVEILEGETGVAVIHIADNAMKNAGAGIKMTKGYFDVHINNNIFSGIKDVSISLENAAHIYVTENVINYTKGSVSMKMTGTEGSFVIENNAFGNKTDIEGFENLDKKESGVNIYVIVSAIFAVLLIVLLIVLVKLIKNGKKV